MRIDNESLSVAVLTKRGVGEVVLHSGTEKQTKPRALLASFRT